MTQLFRKPTCSLCQLSEPRGKFPKGIDHVVFANHKEYKLCDFCVTLVRTDRRLISTQFPKEYSDTPEKRRKWLIREFNRLNPMEAAGNSNKPDLLSEPADPRETPSALYTTPCPKCGKDINVPAGKGGEIVDCPHCGEKVQLPLDVTETGPIATRPEGDEELPPEEETEVESPAENGVTCPGCGAALSVHGGETVRCPQCGRDIEAPLDFAD